MTGRRHVHSGTVVNPDQTRPFKELFGPHTHQFVTDAVKRHHQKHTHEDPHAPPDFFSTCCCKDHHDHSCPDLSPMPASVPPMRTVGVPLGINQIPPLSSCPSKTWVRPGGTWSSTWIPSPEKPSFSSSTGMIPFTSFERVDGFPRHADDEPPLHSWRDVWA